MTQIEVLYDETNGFLLSVLFQVNLRNTDATEADLEAEFYKLMEEEGIITPSDDGKSKSKPSGDDDEGAKEAAATPDDD